MMTTAPTSGPSPSTVSRLAGGASGIELYLARLADQYEFFLSELWVEIGADKQAPLEELDYDIARFVADSSNPTRCVLAFRGVGKTTSGTCAYASWRLYRACYYGEPDFRIKVISKAHTFACNVISMLREWIGIDDETGVWFLRHLRPDESKNHRDNRESFDIGPSTRSKDPSVSAAGIDGMITGTRAHLLIADDVETPENTVTVNSRERLREQVKEFRQIASFGDREILFFGTPHHRESLYDHLATKEIYDSHTGETIRYVVRSWPIILPEPKWLAQHVAPLIRERLSELGRDVAPGEIIPTCPGRFPRRIVLERLAEGEINFARQSMVVADCADLTYPLRLSDLIVPDFEIPRDEGPLWIKWGRTRAGGVSNVREDLDVAGMTGDVLYRQFEVSANTGKWARTVMRVDPSGRGADQTAWAVGSFLAGWVWVKCVKGDGQDKDKPGDDPRILREIAADAMFYGVTEIIIEEQFGGSSFAQLLELEISKLYCGPGQNPAYPDGWRCSIEIRHSKGQKERRIIQSLSTPMANHRVVIAEDAIRVVPGLPTRYQLQYQLSNVTEQAGSLTHDDKIEVMAGVVGEFGEEMRISPEMVEQRILEEQVAAAAAKHYSYFQRPVVNWNRQFV